MSALTAVSVVFQAVFLLVFECHPPASPANGYPGCQQYRAISPEEAACEFYLAINHGATGVLWFTAEVTTQGHITCSTCSAWTCSRRCTLTEPS